MKRWGLILFVSLLVQIFLPNLLSIRGIRPDFLIIFVLYFAVNMGSYRGTLIGFGVGIVGSIFDSGIIFGVLSLIYSLVGYAGGYLKKQHYKMVPLNFNFLCFLIILIGFLILTYLNYNYLFYNDIKIFIFTWFQTSLYTIAILAGLQFFVPLLKS